MARILIIDDEENIRSSLKSALNRRGHETVTAANCARGREFAASGFDLIFLDVMLPDGNGVDLLKTILSEHPAQAVVMISGHADVDMAVEAIRSGAYDFIEKPLSLERMLVTVDNVTQRNSLIGEKDRLARKVYPEFVGQSEVVQKLLGDIRMSAPRAARFLITGENGTGKELIAHMIHRESERRKGPFVAVNCAALPSELVESELFGHTAGAFTGASRDRRGRFREADSGSIFLDEIGDMPLAAQAKILRVIETRKVMAVGSDSAVTVDCNIIAASNRNLEALVEKSEFRQDLLYRLNVVQLSLPPLRERREDIPLLANHFLGSFAIESGVGASRLSEEAIALLQQCRFAGNVRELRNLMERVSIYCRTQTVSAEDLQPMLPGKLQSEPRPLKEAVSAFEKEYIGSLLLANDGNVAKTARQLGLDRTYLHKKLKKLGLVDNEK
ncbi:MAG: sigma-54-dependent transcriptional regulator [Candidatus Zixiibacteriota bacterium]